MKKTALLLVFILIFSNVSAIGQVVDYYVFNTPPLNTYTGFVEATGLINNATFNDISGHWANEAIIHSASLGILNFPGNTLNPDLPITFQEGLAIAVNLLGEGNEVLQEGLDFINDHVVGGEVFWAGTLEDTMHLGNLVVARDNNIISDMMFNALVGIPLFNEDAVFELAIELDTAQENLDLVQYMQLMEQLNDILSDVMEEFNILDPLEVLEILPTRTDNIRRDELARFLVRAVSESNEIQLPISPRDILTFNDWQNIGSQQAQYVEAFVRLNIMQGIGNGSFNPAGTISRAEVAQIIRNLEDIYYNLQNIQRNVGTVAANRESQTAATLQGVSNRDFYIRRHDGDVDRIRHTVSYSPTNQTNFDVPVFRNGQVGGLSTLQVNDQIEYLTQGNIVIYINVIETEQVLQTEIGRLTGLDISNGTITLRDDNNNHFTYNMTSGIFGISDGNEYVLVDGRFLSLENLPFGDFVELSLINNLVNNISFIGQPELVREMRGIVIDNNPTFGYITVIDNNANIVTRFYNQNNMSVQRQDYFETAGAGYIAQMFPHFAFNPFAANIADIQPGDIVFMRFDENDPTLITAISATIHPVVRHGLVLQTSNNNGVTSILLRFDNGQTSWFDIGPNIFVTRAGRTINNNQIQEGDRLRLLVNQAILAPGHVVESILEVSLENEGHHISTILNGNLAGINNMQNNLMLQNSRPLTGLGWGGHTQIQELNLNRQNIDFFHENERISMAHAQRFLSRSDLNTYVAMDTNPAGNNIRQITFRNGRDELLNAETVISTNGNGGFFISGINGLITTDNGTIIRRAGRQVSGTNIMEGDIVRVSLNGGNNAAVVDILERPGTANVGIARVRIIDVNEGSGFTVQSMATLQGHEWMFTPVERTFTIDPNTLFLNANGFVNPNEFIGFTENSVVDRTFTVIYDGTRATHIIEAPYGNRVVRGSIFNINETANTIGGVAGSRGTIGIRDAMYLHNPSLSPEYQWNSISNVNPVMNIMLNPNTIIIRNNRVVQPRDLQNGDRIRVLTNNLPETVTPNAAVSGQIILVDN
ncbi:MAG: S-layer homology domain-containing protein [Defluviitaleaceae bacterium]|nr:S-layer homology domain-containing protein [Defluviitaleaceae bacterium]